MKASFYAGASGLIAQQEAMNTIGNNIANVNTYGYKAQTVSFKDLLYNNMYANTNSHPLSGNGVQTVHTGINPEPTAMLSTNSTLDFAISGPGWFGVDVNGKIQYTRNGNFTVGLMGGNAYLITNDGGFVLNSKGERIQIPQNATTDQLDFSNIKNQLGVYDFPNANALVPLSSTMYMQSEASGNAKLLPEGAYKLLQSTLEQSGVSITDEMANIIQTQRAYQVSARVLQTSDENEQTINNLRK